MTYRMPAEWEPHECTWLAWPHNEDDWPGRFGPIPWVYGEVIRHLSRRERVELLIPAGDGPSIRSFLARLGIAEEQVRFWEMPTDRVWTRDFAPLWVFDRAGLRHALKWRFNAWAKYDDWQRDEEAGRQIGKRFGPCVEPHHGGKLLVLEGGSIDVNGQGVLLTTEECLLSKEQQRNPGLTRQDYEDLFAEYLGIEKTIWLKRGIVGDDTHGHVDDLARFVSASTIVCVVEPDRGDANYEPLQENLVILRSATDQRGRPFRIVELPMPEPIWFDGQRLPASYANFYIANDLVLVPTFNDLNDRLALNVLADLFPNRQVIGIYCGDLVWGLGTLHCMTMQMPVGRLMA
ncbi:MAG: agmatine deiminase family protein [Gemmatales bacterium]|nr:agmatine deiminase family protein [Gemmatales bacterium]MDW8387143.1 agmatine deiminase family protein [Gemmatales bacterium]